jgi:hypothetical protein
MMGMFSSFPATQSHSGSDPPSGRQPPNIAHGSVSEIHII